MFSRWSRYYHTLKFLKWRQVKYQLWYRLAPPNTKPDQKAKSLSGQWDLQLADSIPSYISWLDNYRFKFLNIEHDFKNKIDWNYNAYGKLWTYNLTYFEFLSQPDLPKEKGLELIHDFIGQQSIIKDGVEPFPISLRIIFWIKFLLKHTIQDPKIDQSLYGQLQMLYKKPEYHLLGNHLLENGFALLFGGLYFTDKKVLKLGSAILEEQLNEQILSDGGHFELSPMYHQLMLCRMLDCINLLKNNPENSLDNLMELLTEKVALMLGWMTQITFSNGDMPLVNDSANEVAPSAKTLTTYAARLEIFPKIKPLKTSGYRKIKMSSYELLMDVGNIGPDYIPGHSHSDTFNFILYHKGQPIVVDTGISTYEKNGRRKEERSTSAHNTLVIRYLNQSEVWGGFRVARRAKITQLKELDGQITATHDGYRRINCEHRRTFTYREQYLEIKDIVTGQHGGTAFLHFHPTVFPQLKDQQITGKFGVIDFENADKIQLIPYQLATGFNQTNEGLKAVISFKDHLHTIIKLT